MDLKAVSVLSVILVLALSTLAEGVPPTKCQCKIEPRNRVNCGYPGITEGECKRAGCCFDSSVSGVFWCFTPKEKKVKKVCPTDAPHRKDCGFPGITAEECERKGCCYNEHPAGVPWCFYHRTVEEAC